MTRIEIVATVDAGQDYGRRIPSARKGVDGHIEAAQSLVPPDSIPTTIAPGHAAVSADREKHASAVVQQFVRDLAARIAAAHDSTSLAAAVQGFGSAASI